MYENTHLPSAQVSKDNLNHMSNKILAYKQLLFKLGKRLAIKATIQILELKEFLKQNTKTVARILGF